MIKGSTLAIHDIMVDLNSDPAIPGVMPPCSTND